MHFPDKVSNVIQAGIDARRSTDEIAVDVLTLIAEAMLSEEHDGPVHTAMSVWLTREFLHQMGNEGEPTHEAVMAFSTEAITAALAAAGITPGAATGEVDGE